MLLRSFNSFWMVLIPFHAKVPVEASHANAHARAIAFFSYIWFKYDILSWHCCKIGGVVVMTLSFQPSALGFDSQLRCAGVIQDAGNRKEMHNLSFFASKPCITVRVGAAMPTWKIASWSAERKGAIRKYASGLFGSVNLRSFSFRNR